MLGNTYQNLEVICINDGSTDGSQTILQKYSDSDSRVQVIYKENGGVSSARNVGLDVASGDYVAFVDSDDWIHPQYFEVIEYFAESNVADMVVCDYDKEDAAESSLKNPADAKADILSLDDCFYHDIKTEIWRHLYKRPLIGDFRFNETLTWGEDTAFNVAALCSRETIKAVYVHRVLYHWSQRETSISHSIHLPSEQLRFFDNYSVIMNEPFIKAQNRGIILCEAIKEFLGYRYMTSFAIGEERLIRNKAIKRRKRPLLNLLRKESLSLKVKITYAALLCFPALYRAWRIYIDRTMLDWERIQKEDRKKKRKGI